jgi:hypothetical protein
MTVLEAAAFILYAALILLYAIVMDRRAEAKQRQSYEATRRVRQYTSW